jgi:hypothetical protein
VLRAAASEARECLIAQLSPLLVQHSRRHPDDERADARECKVGAQTSIRNSTEIAVSYGASTPAPPRKRDLGPDLALAALRTARRRGDGAMGEPSAETSG